VSKVSAPVVVSTAAESPAAPQRVAGEHPPLLTILTYASPTVGVGFMFFLVNMYLMKFSTDVLLIAPGVMGLIFGVSRIWDAISDPLAGYLSDRTHTSLGRRRPWMLASVLPIVAVFLMVWSPPQSLTGNALIAWMAVAVIGFYTAMTIFTVPHASLGAEMSMGYDERTRVFGWRHMSFMAGAFLAVGGMRLLIAAEDPQAMARGLALGAGVFTALLLLFAVVRLRERREHMGRGAQHPFAAFKDVLKNPHTRLLLSGILIEHLGSANITILTPYASQYIIGTPHLTPFYILCYMTASTGTALLWVQLAKRYDKKRLWVFAMVLSGIAFGGMFLGDHGDWLLIASLATLGGIAGGCGPVVAFSILSDVVDYDEYVTGQRKEGAYFAAFSFVFKGSMGLTLMITGFVLQLSGFQPNVEQTETAKLAIGTLFALLPMTTFWCGALLLSRFQLSREAHTQLRAAIERRKRGGEH
jgi:GPH family glycoside/pentoside/hexuronide:cation symporter